MLSEADRALIAAATVKAESETSGEIACVVTEEVSAYREIPLAAGAGVALLGPPLAVALGLRLEAFTAPFAGWTAAHGPASAGPILTVYAVVQVMLFALAVALASVPAVRRALTPRGLKQRRVRRAALQHFAGARQHLAPGQTMVLIFASLGDRQMEIVADEAIHAKVGQGAWDEAVAQALATMRTSGAAAGLAKAVEVCGATLAAHFPDDGGGNAFPDRVLEL
ncbi:MAG TPA: TPM domain-containing protein [Caulobacteraceae bacterium]|jgi:putative membrane protein|nr:TPM domain-containing protein [Caulobacteraceae bacterium]